MPVKFVISSAPSVSYGDVFITRDLLPRTLVHIALRNFVDYTFVERIQ